MSVIAKYVGQVRHNFEMSGTEIKHFRIVVNVEEMFVRKKYIKYLAESFLFAGHPVAKCPARNQNVR